MTTLEQNSTLRRVTLDVYAAGLVPLARSTGSMWRRVRDQPWRILIAVPATAGILVVACLYTLLATLVPMCVAFMLVLASPIIAFVAITGPFGPRGRIGGRGRSSGR